jgi:hypothetical protein
MELPTITIENGRYHIELKNKYIYETNSDG